MIAILGLTFFIAITYIASENRKAVSKRLVLSGIALQLVLAVLVLGVPKLGWSGPLEFLFEWANRFFLKILSYTEKGTEFLLGPYADKSKYGFVFFIHALPTIIFFSSLMSLLYHLKIMQKIVNAMAWVMFKVMKVSGAESVSMAANIFVGQTEAPLVVKPYLDKMTRSELMTLMTGGFATIAGSVLAAFVGLLSGSIPNIAGHLLTASVMSAPAALVFAKIMLPETETPETLESVPDQNKDQQAANMIEAAANGASEGVKMLINVAAMLLAFIALIAAANGVLGFFSELIHFNEWGNFAIPQAFLDNGQNHLSLQLFFSWIFAPIAWLMGIPWADCITAGVLLGEKIAINEFVAYGHLAQVTDQLQPRTTIILSYALCGFANFSSIAIQLGGIGELAPSRKTELAQFGLKAMICGSFAAFSTACIASLLI